ncbi:MAG TPA: polysaccharide deacetylase family protein [Flavisolibacter sp.]
MLLYTKTNSPRLQYIAHFLGSYFETEVEITSDLRVFTTHTGVRINYSEQRLSPSELWIAPVELLFQEGIQPVTINIFDHPQGYKAFFQTACPYRFDLFAAIFYLVSRYEEYLPHQKDSYGRYAHTASLAFREGFLHLPLVNIWLHHFLEQVLEIFRDAKLRTPPYRFVPTYDIDIAWSYQHKGLLRNAGGAARSLISGNWAELGERGQVLLRRKEDPYDSYQWMDRMHDALRLKPIYFFHVGLKRYSFDKNTPVRSAAFQQLIRKVAGKYGVGLHPSWRSGTVAGILEKEKTALEAFTGGKIMASRQHYIRLSLPTTYEQLLAAGIRDDYSMGYGSINGFRASVAFPFFFYNLEKEEATNLLVHPFCYMEANSFFEQQLTAEEALGEMLHYHNAIKKAGGTCITIWHNHFLGEAKRYAGWREIYKKALELISAS